MGLKNVRIFNTLLLLYLLLLINLFSSGMVEGFREGITPNLFLYQYVKKDGIQKNNRKLLMDVLDYDDTGANPRHDPRRKGGKP